MPKGYTTRQEIENLLLIDIDPSFYAQVDRWIEWAEDYIDQYTGRNFVADATATERYFSGDDRHDLRIDEAFEVTKVESGMGDGGAYTEIPLGGSQGYRIRPQLPIDTILLMNGYWSTSGRPSYRVTARWGFSETAPAIIRQAATLLVAGILNSSRAQGASTGDVRSESIGTYSVTYGTESQWQAFEQLRSGLEFYRRIAI